MPPTWLLITTPPELPQFIPFIFVVKVAVPVVVVILIELFTVLEPIVFPSPAKAPPILIPDPVVTIPSTAIEAATVGTDDKVIFAMVFPFIFDTGDAPDVVSIIPWNETLPSVDE